MDYESINIIVKSVAAIISVILTVFVVPWLKNKVSEDKLLKIKELCELAVRCAEQIYTPEQWKEKKEYVFAYICEKSEEINIHLSIEDVNNLIEGVVNEVKHS